MPHQGVLSTTCPHLSTFPAPLFDYFDASCWIRGTIFPIPRVFPDLRPSAQICGKFFPIPAISRDHGDFGDPPPSSSASSVPLCFKGFVFSDQCHPR
jgi:hypothetical protein